MKIIDLLLKIFIFFSLVILFYTIYRMSVYFVNGIELKIIFEKYTKYLIFSSILLIFFFIISKVNYSLKINIILSFFSILVIIYIIEFFLFIKFPDQEEKNFSDNGNDKDSELIKIKKFIEEDIFPFDVIPKKFDIDNKKIYPISYISNTKIFLCNEVGIDVFYNSDKFGFRNSNKDWERPVTDYALIGDSFIHGACEKDNNIISNYLKKKKDQCNKSRYWWSWSFKRISNIFRICFKT